MIVKIKKSRALLNILKLLFVLMIFLLSSCGKTTKIPEIEYSPKISNLNFDWKYSCDKEELAINNISFEFYDENKEPYFDIYIRKNISVGSKKQLDTFETPKKPQYIYKIGGWYYYIVRVFTYNQKEAVIKLGPDYVLKIEAEFENVSGRTHDVITKHLKVNIQDPDEMFSNGLTKSVSFSETYCDK